jgi:hypothetical protein
VGLCGIQSYFFRDLLYVLQKKWIDSDRADRFTTLLGNNGYFSSEAWRGEYRKYASENQLHSVSSSTLTGDLSLRYIRMILRRDYYIPLMVLPLAAFCLFCVIDSELCTDAGDGDLYLRLMTLLGLEALYGGLVFVLSRHFFGKWLKDNPQYREQKDEIIRSYLEGYLFSCSYFCVVVGQNYVHGFDGRRFHTLPRDGIKRGRWLVECDKILWTLRNSDESFDAFNLYVRDEYRFNIYFLCTRGDYYSVTDNGEFCARNRFCIPLDQFQVKMIMDRFFQKISSDMKPVFIERNRNRATYVSIRRCMSPLILDKE